MFCKVEIKYIQKQHRHV